MMQEMLTAFELMALSANLYLNLSMILNSLYKFQIFVSNKKRKTKTRKQHEDTTHSKT